MPVNSTHPQYDAALPAWTMCSDFVNGTTAVKAKGEKYLPRPNPNDDSLDAMQRYKNYLKRAVFYEYSSKTVSQYIGLAFKQDPICELDERLAAMKYNADGQGTSLYHQAQKGLKSLLVNGRFGIWVDFPTQESKTSQKDDTALPKLLFYPAQSIINWRDDMIVLQEMVSIATDDPFVVKRVEQWRVLGIDEVGYYVEVWTKGEDGFSVNGRQYPKQHGDKHWQTIPFQIFGSQYNTFDEQEIPIEPLVHIEQGIYCNSADAENSRFICGQIQPFLNVDNQTADWYKDKKLKLGSETVIMLGEHGSFGFAQASPNTMATEGIADKRQIISELGYQLGQSGGGIKTATQADNEQQAQHSQVSLCVANINEGFTNLLNWCNLYKGAEKPPKFTIRQQFNQTAVNMELLQGLASLIDGGKLPKAVLYDKAKEYNLLDVELSHDDIDGMIEANNYEAINQFGATKKLFERSISADGKAD
ncbi:DUF4055 domain-containing protein [Moraxella sp. ZJ142]|uniref:DUF4055 domain-containing protein n=1 Tax=Moraxella marmotae TaxID=3344520 RepID=UPI0035D41DAE